MRVALFSLGKFYLVELLRLSRNSRYFEIIRNIYVYDSATGENTLFCSGSLLFFRYSCIFFVLIRTHINHSHHHRKRGNSAFASNTECREKPDDIFTSYDYFISRENNKEQNLITTVFDDEYYMS
ncbi:hypothetical protein PGB90_007531 [Kerria lacca]